MASEAVEAGLVRCDLMHRYSDHRSSTPTRERVCSSDNIECWDGGYNEPSNIASQDQSDCNVNSVNNDILWIGGDQSPPPLHIPSSPSTFFEVELDQVIVNEEDISPDVSYGGAWGPLPQGSPLPPLVESSPSGSSGVSSAASGDLFTLNGISQLNSNESQVLHNPISDPADSNSIPNFKDKGWKVLKTINKIKKAIRERDGDEGDFPQSDPSLLERAICHAKTKKECRDSNSSQSHLSDFRMKKIRILTSNIRGYHSKRESFQAIMTRENIDIAAICETFMSGNRYPELAGYTSYFRNRPRRAMGGIALLIRDELARYAVKVDEGKEENEFLIVKWTNCSPNLVIAVYYGNQKKVGVDQVKLHLSQLLVAVKKQMDLGCQVHVVGDFNVQLGDKVIPGNFPEPDPTGRIFSDQLELMGLEILNKRCSDPTTFIDRSGKDHRRSVLDLVISNRPDTISEFKTDNEDQEFTPYSVHMKKGVSSRTYADHFSITYNMETWWQERIEVKKEPIWNYKKLLGNVKYDLFTSNACNYLMHKIETEPDINVVHKSFCKVMTKGKFQSYGKRTVTVSQLKRINDDLVWRQRISDLDKLQKQYEDEKETNQIYKIRKNIIQGQRDRQNVAVEVDETGEVLEDLDEVLDHILHYNVVNMQKVEPSKQVEAIMKQKAAVIDLMLEDEKVQNFPSEIPWEVYLKVVKKVLTQKKSCFRDFIKAGRNFKFAVYKFLNRMYSKEEFPEVSSLTFLTKIWKRKGNQSKLKNNRFIHSKECYSKLLEKCVVEIIAHKLDEATPQLQAGSRKGRSTRDQLLKVIVMQKFQESGGKPLPILLVDVKSCFDRMVLEDVVYDTIEAGADLKATRVLKKFSDKTEIRLRGDPRNNGQGVGRHIRGTLGQGSNFAPPGIGLTTSKSLWSQFKDSSGILASLGQVVADPQSYVDDMATMPMNEQGLKEASRRIGAALEGISLNSHPEKTEVIISGRNQKATTMRENLIARPALMQGHPVKVVDSGMYLGMKISQQGHRDTVDLTVRHRIAKTWGRVAEIKNQINDARMSRLGWFRAGVQLIRSVIIPSLTYSSDVWVAMNKSTEKLIKDEYKSMIYVTLDITTHTKWTSVLADLQLPGIISVVDKLRVSYINHTLWGGGDSKLKEMLEEEHRLNPKNSLISMTDKICDLYKIPRVSETQIHRPIIKRQVKLMDEIETWIGNITSSATQNVGVERTRVSTNFFKLTKRETQALIAHNAGAFKLKTAWGNYHDIQACLAPMCDQLDEIEHIKRCPHYESKWKDSFDDDCKTLAKYFVAVDRERRRRWRGEVLF